MFYFQLSWPFCETDNFANYCRGPYKKQFSEMILKSDHWFRRRSHLKDSFLFLAMGDISVTDRNNLSKFDRELKRKSSVKQFKSDHRFKRRRRLKDILFLVLGAILFNGPEQSEQFQQRAFIRNISLKQFSSLTMGLREVV